MTVAQLPGMNSLLVALLTEAKTWLGKAFALEWSKELKFGALRDVNLESSWQHIDELRPGTSPAPAGYS